MKRSYDRPACTIVNVRLNTLMEIIDLQLGSGTWSGEAAAKEQLPAKLINAPEEEEEETTIASLPRFNVWED